MKRLFILFISTILFEAVTAQKAKPVNRDDKKAERKELINQRIKQEEEGALIFNKQNLFAIKLNTDGYGIFIEKSKYKTTQLSNLWWVELGERKHPKEEKLSIQSNILPGLTLGNPFIYGKQNNFFYLKFGFGQQRLIGGKGNKNGIAVAAVYGGGLSLGMLKPYYLEIQEGGNIKKTRYDGTNEATFLDPNKIMGGGSLFNGFNEIKYVPGAHIRGGLRFDYGRFNEIASAVEVGVNAEFYGSKMPIMLRNPEKNFFYGFYVALVFGRRK